jgi:hypothetical protein
MMQDKKRKKEEAVIRARKMRREGMTWKGIG